MYTIKKIRAIQYLALIFIVNACNYNNKSSGSIVQDYKDILPERTVVNPGAVKTYNEVIKSFATTDTFKVDLYETEQTFNYLIKINYKQLDAEDTLRIPNFGANPIIEIKKGDKRPSCVIGFLDEHKQFRESKMVFFEDSEIKVHVLKHYAVAVHQDTVK